MFGTAKKGERSTIMPSGWENNLKISKQSLLFLLFLSAHHDAIMTSNVPLLYLHPKNADARHNWVKLLNDISTVLIVIKASLRIVWLVVRVRGGVEDTRLEAKDTKKSEAKAKDSLSEDRHSQGQGPRTQAQVHSKKKKKKGLHKNFSGASQKFFRRSPRKNVFQKIFQALHKILTIQKIVLSSSRGQANFRGLEASRPRTWPSRPRTSKSVLEAKDVLEDSTSGQSIH